MPDRTTKKQPNNPFRAAFAALAGTSIEWYDFYAFATAAALVFDDVFFPPDMPPLLKTLSAFATFAVGFLLRPLGGIVFGHMGDKVGRKNTLVITLLMMGVASFAIGLLPTYAQIGAWAPALLVLLRLIQGIAIGGEWGGAVLVAVENAPKGRSAFFGSFAQLGSSVGALLSTGAFSLMHLFGGDAFQEWGWRVPFLASAVLVGVGLFVRLKLEESPVMEQVRAERKSDGAAVREGGGKERLPVVEVFQTSWRTVLVGIFALATATGGYYMVTTYLLSYGTDQLRLSESMLLDGLTLAALLELLVTPGLAWLADRLGAHRVVIFGLAGVIVLAVPQFLALGTGNVLLIYLTMLATRFAMSALYGPVAAIIAEGFAPRVRYTGISLSYQICNMIFGGLAPMAAISLTAFAHGSYWPAATMLMAVSALGIWCTARLRTYRVRRETAASASAAHASGAEPGAGGQQVPAGT
ncbi:MFS transporter [Streptomyces iconiensis]|uniref:MFS transporter n=1 Tax=Streptomyces iconiensis TaxID=1384038 RepID=A0ABT7A7F8_9ACTN|nr:MFS transporter [Streptomyces iconiensis]MDJ1137270.1 MFS transporter [Streptomyces iconiensis]